MRNCKLDELETKIRASFSRRESVANLAFMLNTLNKLIDEYRELNPVRSRAYEFVGDWVCQALGIEE